MNRPPFVIVKQNFVILNLFQDPARLGTPLREILKQVQDDDSFFHDSAAWNGI